ncbi:mitochondrial ornithine transporter-like [Tropilaelaps mercedesae]|uniref:Mitochondrial ornithine transporter-like n=1 Tax=Tropilaelaps mercedesae TaxID=418985 RepID=A0A1V9XX24_9ACAR|nr:mitochondrial ornithine transporter-like [Tropilaelaps mercedesae]
MAGSTVTFMLDFIDTAALRLDSSDLPSSFDERGSGSVLLNISRMEKIERRSASGCTEAFRIAIIDFLAGTLGGVATVLIGQPLDTVKVKMQTFPKLYSSTRTCLQETFRHDGIIRGLYAGTSPALVANISENAMLFGAYGVCQTVVKTMVGKRVAEDLSTAENAISGGLAAIFSSLTLCPTELVKCKLQALRETSGKKPTVTMTAMYRSIYRKDGFRGFYRGIGATVAREVPGYFAFFGGYEGCRQCFATYYKCHKADIGILGTAISGGVAGACIWLVIFPADVVKSRLQVLDNKTTSSTLQHLYYYVLFQLANSMLRSEGIGAFYYGLTPTLIRTLPATSILFLVVEFTKNILV